ncbi:MAG TPA: hypothetical protein VLA37_01515 [Sphingomonadaceae bacterium]|nr:hypothetical protein [Sphingomonadaceae bacterium]
MRGTIGATMIVLAGYSFAPLAAQDEPPALAEYEAPDFSSVTGEEDVATLVEAGELVRVMMVPLAFGGTDSALNTAYLPPQAAAEWQLIEETMVELAETGIMQSFELLPEYRGESLVPTRLVVHANHLDQGEPFDLTVEVW